jgi:hypothetical protein
MCLVDSCTTNSILREIKYLQTLTQRSKNVLTIAGRDVMIEDSLLYHNSTRTLISFRDIQKSGLHIYTHEDNKEEFLLITNYSGYCHEILERISSTLSVLYYTYIKHAPHVAYKVVFHNIDIFKI